MTLTVTGYMKFGLSVDLYRVPSLGTKIDANKAGRVQLWKSGRVAKHSALFLSLSLLQALES